MCVVLFVDSDADVTGWLFHIVVFLLLLIPLSVTLFVYYVVYAIGIVGWRYIVLHL